MTKKPSMYDLLLTLLRTAQTLTQDQKDDYIRRLESGEWDAALQTELGELCRKEVAFLKARGAEIDGMIATQERFLKAREDTLPAKVGKVVDKAEERMQRIRDEHDIAQSGAELTA